MSIGNIVQKVTQVARRFLKRKAGVTTIQKEVHTGLNFNVLSNDVVEFTTKAGNLVSLNPKSTKGLELLQAKLRDKLIKLNTSTVADCLVGERFGIDGIRSILECADTKENISIINATLNQLKRGKQVGTADVIQAVAPMKFPPPEMGISGINKFLMKIGVRRHRQAKGFLFNGISVIESICLKKSLNPKVIELEEKMLKMGYNANFADNLETAEIIVKAYEKMAKMGYKMPKEIKLMVPTKDGILGFMPYAAKGKEFETPIFFSKDLAKSFKEIKVEVPDFLKKLGIEYNATNSPESVVYHEVGHFLHSFDATPTDKAIRLWKDLANDGFDIEMAKEVGFYAMTGDHIHMGKEFVAEVFAGLMEGKQYSQRVMDLYSKLGGPKII